MDNYSATPPSLKQGERFPLNLNVSDSWDIFADDEHWDDDIAELNSTASAVAEAPEDALNMDLFDLFSDSPGQPEVLTEVNDGERSSILNGLGLQSPAPTADPVKQEIPTSCAGGSHDELTEDQDGQVCNQVGSPSSSIAASGSDTDNDVDLQTNLSSSASVSEEYSDDGSVSRSNTAYSCVPAARRGTAMPEKDGTSSTSPSCESVTGVKRSAKSASLCPRPFLGPSSSFGDFSRISQQVAQHGMSTVTSGLGAPLLPFTVIPAFQVPAGGPCDTAVDNMTATMSTLPGLRDLQATAVLTAASEAASQAIAAGWKRLKGQDSASKVEVKPGVEEGRRRVLLSKTSASGNSDAEVPGGEEVGINIQRRRSKKEERLMKNREAANRSRLKRKEVLSDLKNLNATLSRNLEESRLENNALKADITSLREENSFLRGMLSPAGHASELPLSSTSQRVNTPRGGVATPGGGARSGGGAAGVSAVAGVVGTALAVISCVAISAPGYAEEKSARSAVLPSVAGNGRAGFSGGTGGMHSSRMGGGRALMTIDDTTRFAEPQHGTRLWDIMESVISWNGLAVIIFVVGLFLLVDVARRHRRNSRRSSF